MGKIGTDEAEGLGFVPLFQAIDLFNGLFVHDITADTIKGVSGVADEPPLLEDIHNFIDHSGLGIIGIYVEQHDFIPFSG